MFYFLCFQDVTQSSDLVKHGHTCCEVDMVHTTSGGLHLPNLCAFPHQGVLLVMSIKLMGQMKRKQEFMALLQSNRYVPGAF